MIIPPNNPPHIRYESVPQRRKLQQRCNAVTASLGFHCCNFYGAGDCLSSPDIETLPRSGSRGILYICCSTSHDTQSSSIRKFAIKTDDMFVSFVTSHYCYISPNTCTLNIHIPPPSTPSLMFRHRSPLFCGKNIPINIKQPFRDDEAGTGVP